MDIPVRTGLQLHRAFRRHLFENNRHLFHAVIFKLDFIADAALESRIGFQEFPHFFLITSQNDHHVIFVVFDGRYKLIHGLVPEGIPVVPAKGIGFVDKEDAAHCFFYLLFDQFGRVPLILAHQVAPGAGYHMAAVGKNAKLLVNSTDEVGHRGLPGAGISGKQHMKRPVSGCPAGSLFLGLFLNEDRLYPFLNLCLYVV